MKYFILICGLLINTAQAKNWMSLSDVATSNLGGQGSSSYRFQRACQTTEGEACFKITGKDLRFNTVQQRRQGNYEAATVIVDCANRAACLLAIADPLAKCGNASFQAFWGDLDNDNDLESWCTRRAFIGVLLEKAVLKTAARAADKAKSLDLTKRATKQRTRNTRLENCAKNTSMTGAQQINCIRALARELAKLRLNESEL